MKKLLIIVILMFAVSVNAQTLTPKLMGLEYDSMISPSEFLEWLPEIIWVEFHDKTFHSIAVNPDDTEPRAVELIFKHNGYLIGYVFNYRGMNFAYIFSQECYCYRQIIPRRE